MKKYIAISSTKLPYGFLGNMSPHPISALGNVWRTSEALFQAMRFDDTDIQEQIRLEPSPIGAKLKAKKYADKMTVIPKSELDVLHMEICLLLKLQNHPDIKRELLNTGDDYIYEDVKSRPRGNNLFWGSYLSSDGEMIGENQLGKLWMRLRDELRSK